MRHKMQFRLKTLLMAAFICGYLVYVAYRMDELGPMRRMIAVLIGGVGFALSMMPEAIDSLLKRSKNEEGSKGDE